MAPLEKVLTENIPITTMESFPHLTQRTFEKTRVETWKERVVLLSANTYSEKQIDDF